MIHVEKKKKNVTGFAYSQNNWNNSANIANITSWFISTDRERLYIQLITYVWSLAVGLFTKVNEEERTELRKTLKKP